MPPTVVFVLFLILEQIKGYSGKNIARGGQVAQSSVGWSGIPERVIDGNRDSTYNQGSCSHTKRDLKPWLRLDLLKMFKVKTVTITNRGDCCSDRLNGAEIRIGNSLIDNGNANPKCTVIKSIAGGRTETFECHEMEGRYINIVIPDRREYLTLCEVEVEGIEVSTGKNIARGGQVAQSSVGWSGIPERVIDGNRDSTYHQGSCSHTKHDLKPWLRLDLLKMFKVKTVTITNRGDCCSDRLNGAEIRIGNSLIDNGNANPKCTVIKSIAGGRTETFECHEMEGRYINIVIPDRREYLTLCEVEVEGIEVSTGKNIARGGQVAQSSVGWSGIPERVIDGNRDSTYNQGSCSHTKRDLKPWLRLDLLKMFKVKTVTITNRGDCCSDRLNGAEIRIGNSLIDNGNANPKCTVIKSIAGGRTETFECHEMEGRYINIVIPDRREYLTLCEVEVEGIEVSTGKNIARGGQVAQSSVGWSGIPERVIDGNRDSTYHQGSCSHTKHDLKPWLRLDLLKMFKVKTVTITNRGDCCSDRLNGAEIRIGNSLIDNGNANPKCTVIKSIAGGRTETFECHEMEGRYINIVIPDRREYLTLCEVEVEGIEVSTGDDCKLT